MQVVYAGRAGCDGCPCRDGRGQAGRSVIAGLLALVAFGCLFCLLVLYFFLGPDWFPATVLAIGVVSILFATAFAVLARCN